VLFKDRHWLDREFPAIEAQVREHSSTELCGPHIAISAAMIRSSNDRDFPEIEAQVVAGSAAPVLIEAGCGAGNAAFPLLDAHPSVKVDLHKDPPAACV